MRIKIDADMEIEGFQWDKGTKEKNYLLHNVTISEIEEIFFNAPLLFFDDEEHSEKEKRTLALGRTNISRRLSVIFTIRNKHIRAISARDMSRKEREVYEKATKENTTF